MQWGRGCLPGGVCPGLGVCPGGCLPEGICPGRHTLLPKTAIEAGGTHPTGMHSCFLMKLFANKNNSFAAANSSAQEEKPILGR